MRSLKKNKQTIWYAIYEGKEPVYERDSDNQIVYDAVTGKPIRTGEYVTKYKKPVKTQINVSGGRSSADMEVFGTDVNYDRIISTTDVNVPITETSLIWIETQPRYIATNTVDPKSADYTVSARPIKTLNGLQIAISNRRKNGDGING